MTPPLEYNQFIRRVCLPCMPDNCVDDAMSQDKKTVSLKAAHTLEEQCEMQSIISV